MWIEEQWTSSIMTSLRPSRRCILCSFYLFPGRMHQIVVFIGHTFECIKNGTGTHICFFRGAAGSPSSSSSLTTRFFVRCASERRKEGTRISHNENTTDPASNHRGEEKVETNAERHSPFSRVYPSPSPHHRHHLPPPLHY